MKAPTPQELADFFVNPPGFMAIKAPVSPDGGTRGYRRNGSQPVLVWLHHPQYRWPHLSARDRVRHLRRRRLPGTYPVRCDMASELM